MADIDIQLQKIRFSQQIQFLMNAYLKSEDSKYHIDILHRINSLSEEELLRWMDIDASVPITDTSAGSDNEDNDDGEQD